MTEPTTADVIDLLFRVERVLRGDRRSKLAQECQSLAGKLSAKSPATSAAYQPPIDRLNYQCHGCGEFAATYTNGHRDVCEKCWVTTEGALHYTQFAAPPAERLAAMDAGGGS